MPDTHQALGIRYAVRTDVGRHRDSNEDAAYAGPRLLAVDAKLGPPRSLGTPEKQRASGNGAQAGTRPTRGKVP